MFGFGIGGKNRTRKLANLSRNVTELIRWGARCCHRNVCECEEHAIVISPLGVHNATFYYCIVLRPKAVAADGG